MEADGVRVSLYIIACRYLVVCELTICSALSKMHFSLNVVRLARESMEGNFLAQIIDKAQYLVAKLFRRIFHLLNGVESVAIAGANAKAAAPLCGY